MSDIALPKNQAVLDRLRRRIENYRGRHEESLPRFEHTTNGLNEQQKSDTLLLRNRFLESKAKKSHKNKDKKGDGGSGSSKAKRHLDEDGSLGGEGLDGVPSKKMCGVDGGGSKRGTKVNNNKLFPGGSGPGGISSVGGSGGVVTGGSGGNNSNNNKGVVGGFLDSSEYVDLEQLMALEEDPASSMLMMGDSETFKELLSDFDYQDMDDFELGGYEDKSDITTTTTTPSSSSSLPGNSTNSNLVGGGGGSSGGNNASNIPAVAPVTPGSAAATVKIEEYMLHQPLCAGPSPAPAATASPLASQLGSSEQQQQQHHYHGTSSPLNNNNTGSSSGNNSSKRLPMYSASPGSSSGLSIDNSAAQTLKHMAEQRQHKTGAFKTSPARSPYSDSYPPSNSTFPPSGQDFVAGLVGGSGGATSSSGGNPNSNSGGVSSNCYGPRLGESPDLSSIKQEVYSPTTQTTFSPGFMDVNSVNQSKRGGPGVPGGGGGGPSRIQQQQQQQQQVLSPVNKSFNHQNSAMDNNMPGQSFMGRPPNISNNNPSPSGCYPGGFPANPVSSVPQQMPGRGSPIDSKVRNNLPNLQQQQHQQQQFYSYNGMGGMAPGGGQPQQQQSSGGSMVVDSFNPSGMSPGVPQQQTSGPQGQTINFTQQHLRPSGPPPGPNIPPARMAVPPANLNRMPPRMLTASDPMNPMSNPRMQMQQQQQPPQQLMRQQQQQIVPQPHPQQQQQQQQQQPQQGMMMNRFPRNGPRGPPPNMMMPGMPPQQRHSHMQQQQMQQHHQAYNGQQQMMMSGGGQYNNGNHNPNNPNHMQQSTNMSPMRDPQQQQQQQQQQWMSMQQQQHNPHMDPNSRQYPNMNGIVHSQQQQQPGPLRHHGTGPMSYHSGMNMPMSQSQQHPQQSMNNGFGGGGNGGMMSYPNQQQHLSGFNQGGNVNKGPQTHSSQGMYNVNPNYGMKTGMMPQQQQQQHPGMYGSSGNNGPNTNASKMSGLNPDLLNFDQVLDNLVQGCPVPNGEADPSGFSSDDFLLESNYA